MTITITDGRGALWQWDTGRRVKITDGVGVKQIHYQKRCFGCSVDVDVEDDGTAIIPDELLQDYHRLTAYAYATDDTGAYTMVQQDFAVYKRAKPADYVYTPTEHAGFDRLRSEIGDLADLTTEAKDTLVAAINEVALSSGTGSMSLRVADGHIQYSTDSGETWQNLIAVADLKGAKGDKGDPGEKGDTGATGPAGVPGKDGTDGKPGAAGADGAKGADGITPTIGPNGNWYLGKTDTGKPSRGATGASGKPGAKGDPGEKGDKGDPGVPGKNGSDATVTVESITGALGYKPAAPSDIPVVPDAEISANTAARHLHANKAVLDGITGQVTADKVHDPDHTTDLVQYGAFQVGAQQIISQIPTVDDAMSDTSTNPVQNKTIKQYVDDHAVSLPLTLTYANGQATGAAYTDIRKAIERGRQIKLSVANTPDIIASNARNETNKSVLKFIHTDVGGDTVNITQYTVTAQASGLTVNVKSHEIA